MVSFEVVLRSWLCRYRVGGGEILSRRGVEPPPFLRAEFSHSMNHTLNEHERPRNVILRRKFHLRIHIPFLNKIVRYIVQLKFETFIKSGSMV